MSAVTTLKPVQSNCPLCDQAFEVQLVLNTDNAGGQDSDLRDHPAGFDPLYVEIAQCPACGYCDWVNALVETRSLSAEQKSQLRALLPEGGPAQTSMASMFAAAAMNNGILRDGLEIRGSLYLRAAWCSADAQDHEAEMDYRRRAIECYQTAVEMGPGEPPRTRLLIMYLVGELYRRLGDGHNARLWFDRAIAAGTENPNRHWIVSLAIQQRDDPRDRL